MRFSNAALPLLLLIVPLRCSRKFLERGDAKIPMALLGGAPQSLTRAMSYIKDGILPCTKMTIVYLARGQRVSRFKNVTRPHFIVRVDLK